MPIGTQGEEEVHKKLTVARERWRDRVTLRNRMALARRIGDLGAKWKLTPGDNTRLVEAIATVANELRRARIVRGTRPK
jgi:hypothetical protein